MFCWICHLNLLLASLRLSKSRFSSIICALHCSTLKVIRAISIDIFHSIMKRKLRSSKCNFSSTLRAPTDWPANLRLVILLILPYETVLIFDAIYYGKNTAPRQCKTMQGLTRPCNVMQHLHKATQDLDGLVWFSSLISIIQLIGLLLLTTFTQLLAVRKKNRHDVKVQFPVLEKISICIQANWSNKCHLELHVNRRKFFHTVVGRLVELCSRCWAILMKRKKFLFKN